MSKPISRAKLRDAFCLKNGIDILKLAYKNEKKNGYVSVVADEFYELVPESLCFIPGDFMINTFNSCMLPIPDNPEEVIDIMTIHTEIYWEAEQRKERERRIWLVTRTHIIMEEGSVPKSDLL